MSGHQNSDYRLGAVEAQFAALIWENAPLSSGALVKLCEEHLHWKKSTTYTVLKKLCERGLFQNEGGCVTVLVTKEEYEARQSSQFVEESFSGSLPAFVAAFTREKALTENEISELQALIARARRR
ncbi:MAG: BlaI/MecI/CopY family transcriptional regulator [Clostridia bacterium]|nr:BlaI/MecI/CopY family transcriptional regulator [Clostridia bacterium]